METYIQGTLLTVVLLIACLFLLEFLNINNSEKKVDDQKMQNNEKKIVSEDTSTYRYEQNSRFKIISREIIEDGSCYGTTLKVILDTKTKVTYLQTEKYMNGFGVGIHVLLDADGKPLIN